MYAGEFHVIPLVFCNPRGKGVYRTESHLTLSPIYSKYYNCEKNTPPL